MSDVQKVGAMIIFFGFALMILVLNSDYEDALREQQHYCEMVALWDEFGHLPKQDRPGWPPYNGREMCHGIR